MRCNPPWTDKILTKHWAALEARVGAAWMPVASFDDPKLRKLRDRLAYAEGQLARLRPRRDEFARIEANHPDLGWMDTAIAQYAAEIVVLRPQITKMEKRKPRQHGYREYGCGHYGCVMPTNTPGLVMKITTDQTEAAFVAAYLSMKPNGRPVGIVPYHKLLAIRSESRLKRPVFVLWREEAQHLGADGIRAWIKNGAREFERDYYSKSFKKVMHLVGNCLDAARMVREYTHFKEARTIIVGGVRRMDEAWQLGGPPRGDRALQVAWYLNVFRQNAEQMTTEPMGNYVGQGLVEAFDAGLLLADVHLNNIGMPTGKLAEEIGMTPIITDPGHAIALDDRYSGVQVEEL